MASFTKAWRNEVDAARRAGPMPDRCTVQVLAAFTT
jgi:hypothetical protein